MRINFPKTEDETLRWWKEIGAFETQLKLTEGLPPFTFYDGPPFGEFLYTYFSECGR
jgi:isoleucyl-tRNA synthetase